LLSIILMTLYLPAYKRENISKAIQSSNLTLYEDDICDTSACQEIFEKHPVEKVIHLAAYAGVRPSIERPLLYERRLTAKGR